MTKLELAVLTAITNTADRWGESSVTMAELQEHTGYGRTSLSKAVNQLSLSGAVKVVRTKRNLGRLYKNKYLLVK